LKDLSMGRIQSLGEFEEQVYQDRDRVYLEDEVLVLATLN
jgi:hypothetical protein